MSVEKVIWNLEQGQQRQRHFSTSSYSLLNLELKMNKVLEGIQKRKGISDTLIAFHHFHFGTRVPETDCISDADADS